eukprot:5002364-Pleurochrysis_carterae.AAC.1
MHARTHALTHKHVRARICGLAYTEVRVQTRGHRRAYALAFTPLREGTDDCSNAHNTRASSRLAMLV